MSNAPTLDTPENWDLASGAYAEHIAPFMMEPFVDEFLDRLDLDTGKDVLEVAAGTGALTQGLAKRAKSVLATDFAPQMVDILRQRMKAQGATNVTCKVMDGMALDLDDATFDRAACMFGVMLFPDRGKGFSELRRVLRPGGRAMVSGWAGPDRFEAFGLMMAGLRATFPDMPPPPAPPPVFSLSDAAVFKGEMEAGGFKDVEIHHVARDLELASFDGMWSMLTSGAPPIRALFGRIGEDGVARFRDTLVGMVEDRFGSGPIRITNVATVGYGMAG